MARAARDAGYDYDISWTTYRDTDWHFMQRPLKGKGAKFSDLSANIHDYPENKTKMKAMIPFDYYIYVPENA